CDDDALVFAPYVWKLSGTGDASRAEATMPGAYLRATVTGTKHIAIVIDGGVNRGCPPQSLPVVEYSIDVGAFQPLQLQSIESVYAISMSIELDSQKPHLVEIYFRAADLSAGRWRTDLAHLRLSGLQLDA